MKKKILIVDDEPDIIRVLSAKLKVHNYDVIVAMDGVQAVHQAHSKKPDLIILDIRMPCADGCTVLERLQQSSHTALIPVLFHSALPPEKVAKATHVMKASGYICKPAEANELLRKVAEFLGE